MVNIPKLVKEGNVAYEGFAPHEVMRAKFAWNQAKRAAELCVKAVQRFDLPGNAEPIRRWFGLDPRAQPLHANMLMQVQSKLTQMNNVFLSNPVTLVYAPNITSNTFPRTTRSRCSRSRSPAARRSRARTSTATCTTIRPAVAIASCSASGS